MSARLFVTDRWTSFDDSGKELPEFVQYEVVSPFTKKPEEQNDIKDVGLFQIQKTCQTFAVGSITSIWEWELIKEIEKSMTQEQEQDDLENLRRQDLERQYDENPFEDFSKDFVDEIKDDQIIEKLRQEELEEYTRGIG